MNTTLTPPDREIIKEPLGNGNTQHYRIVNGTAYSAGRLMADGTFNARATSDEVIEVLEHLRCTKARARIFHGDETGMSWLDENDIAGTIGRSSGRIKIPLLIPPGGNGGPGLLDCCIIRIDAACGVTRWQHRSFHLPPIELKMGEMLHLPYEVWVDGMVHARFHTDDERQQYLKLIRGERFPSVSADAGAWGLDR